jgi:hypothetical protein
VAWLVREFRELSMALGRIEDDLARKQDKT